tara:strand:+ start:111 stop:266 length:156 start_codon:yes stop_codon:yes gene_type:complete
LSNDEMEMYFKSLVNYLSWNETGSSGNLTDKNYEHIKTKIIKEIAGNISVL